MNTFHTPSIAATVLTMTFCAAYAEVRVVGPDSEHVYSSDPREAGRLLDDEALQRENERRERAKIERLREREDARRREELDAAEAAQAAPTAYEDQSQIGSSYIGTFGVRHRRHVMLRRPGTMGDVSGHPIHSRQTNARARR
jgi:hypothetical protein